MKKKRPLKRKSKRSHQKLEGTELEDGDDEDFDADDPTIGSEEGMMVVSLAEEGVVESSGEGDEEDDEEEEDVDGEEVEAVAKAAEDDSETDPETEAAVAQAEENQEDIKTSEDDEVRPTPPPFRSPQERKERLIRLMTAIDQVKSVALMCLQRWLWRPSSCRLGKLWPPRISMRSVVG